MEAGQSGEATVSQLLMQKARESDSGNSLLKIIQGKFPSINIEIELMVKKIMAEQFFSYHLYDVFDAANKPNMKRNNSIKL